MLADAYNYTDCLALTKQAGLYGHTYTSSHTIKKEGLYHSNISDSGYTFENIFKLLEAVLYYIIISAHIDSHLGSSSEK